MAASVVDAGVQPSQHEACAGQRVVRDDLQRKESDDQPTDCRGIRQESSRKRKLEATQSEGQSPDRVDHTSSEDERHHDEFVQRQSDAELGEETLERGVVELQPPIGPSAELLQPQIPVSDAIEATQHQEVAAERRAQAEDNPVDNVQPPVEVRQPGTQQSKMSKPPRPEEKRTAVNGKDKQGKTKRAASGKKSAAKSERLDRRRKRKSEAKSSSGITQASAHMLFRCTCQLLRSQVLDYDIRARELEERNATQAKEIEEWEKRVRSLKRELQEYDEELPRNNTAETASLALALVERKPDGVPADLQEEKRPVPSATRSETTQNALNGPTTTVEPTLPPAVLAAEAKLQEEIRKRTQKVNEFCMSVPGFIDTLDQQLTRRR
ncbi:hypothetical protein PHYBOEH_000969 [Phytophthora boehmeriae]|uniref:Uncharacterized protein n=1 Tax=Phytophthora boehmeriae TaxID=109152 RepID=A0A8T1WUQ8_9STRA|nr:hypothetical protein PHYBOEH_000969 [Phytophthora boehmeriae]